MHDIDKNNHAFLSPASDIDNIFSPRDGSAFPSPVRISNTSLQLTRFRFSEFTSPATLPAVASPQSPFASNSITSQHLAYAIKYAQACHNITHTVFFPIPQDTCQVVCMMEEAHTHPQDVDAEINKNTQPVKTGIRSGRKKRLLEAFFQAHPAPKDAHGNVQVLSVAKLFIDNEREITHLRISRETMAKKYNVHFASLTTTIAQLKRKAMPVADLTTLQQEYIAKNPIATTSYGEVTTVALAQYYLERQEDCHALDLMPAQLAAHYGKTLENLRKRISDVKSKLAGRILPAKSAATLSAPGRVLTPATATTLMRSLGKKKLSETKLAEAWIKNKNIYKAEGITRDDLALYNKSSPARLIKRIARIQKLLAEKIWKLDEVKDNYLQQNGPQEKVKAKDVAAYWVANQNALENIDIKLFDMANKYKVSFLQLKLKVSELQNNGLTDKQLQYLEQFGPKKKRDKKTAAKIVADFYIKNKHQLRTMGISLLGLSCQYDVKYGTLCDNIKNIRLDLTPKLTRKATNVLKQLRLEGRKSVAAIARLIFARRVQFEKLNITPAHVAHHFGITPVSLLREMRKSGEEADTRASDHTEDDGVAAQIKQEPCVVPDTEVEPWYLPQIFNNRPVLAPPEDEELVLGHQSGPIREMLADIDTTTLCVTSSPDFPELLQEKALLTAANLRLRHLVRAAQQGTLNTLIKQENYYTLRVNEATPNLGMELMAARSMSRGFVIGIYPGISYPSHQEYYAAARSSDSHFPAYVFETRALRPRKKAGSSKKRPVRTASAVGGHVRSGALAYVNTAALAADGRVQPSQDNNLAAVLAGGKIVAYVATREIRAGEVLLINYGPNFLINTHRPVKQEPAEGNAS